MGWVKRTCSWADLAATLVAKRFFLSSVAVDLRSDLI